MKFRIDSDLAQLSHDQLDQLYDWIGDEGYREAIRLAALPEPEGFGLKLHKTTSSAFIIANAPGTRPNPCSKHARAKGRRILRTQPNFWIGPNGNWPTPPTNSPSAL